ncbi:MAG TPA: hypothetical protein PKA64_08660 [Myxococcota bacterium]|nr:hypothetical protein [Myxococcota bacterium]
MTRLDRRDALALGALLVPYLMMVQRYWFVCDDAFITFRYSRHLAQGLGPRYNLGDGVPVEGYSDFLWMLLAAACERVGAEPRVWMPALSAVIGVGVVLGTYTFLRRSGGAPLLAAASATLFLVTFPPFAVWSTSGLETMAEVGLMFATFALLATRDDDRGAALAGLAGLGLALVRTEGIAWAAVLGGLSALSRRLSGRPIARPIAQYAATIMVPFAIYFVWRFRYYHAWVANTAVAKVHMEPVTLLRGLMYLALYALTLLTPLALGWALPAAWRSDRKPIVLFAGLMAVGVPAYAVTVSGDYMAWFRILVPGVPFFAILLGLGWKVWADDPARRARVAPMATALAVLNLLPAFDVHLVPEAARDAVAIREKLGFFRSENQQWQAMNDHVVTWTEKGQALAQYARPGDTYVAAAIGAMGYYSDVFVYDRNGLVNREVAMQPWTGELRSPGHDKVVDRSFFFKENPTILDSEVVGGSKLRPQIREALREMDANPVRDRYYPDLVEVDVPHPAGPKPRYLLALRLADDPADSERRWAEFNERWVNKKAAAGEPGGDAEEGADEP